MTRVIVLNTSLAAPYEAHLSSLLQGKRKERYHRQKTSEARLQTLCGGLLLQAYLGEEPTKTGPFGKPIAEGISFNLSHSGPWVLLALSHRPVGVDVELLGRVDQKVADRCFSPEEQAWAVRRFGGTDRGYGALWTRKESFMKVTGLGFRLPPERIRLPEGDEQIFSGVPHYFATDWSLPGACFSLCTWEPGYQRTLLSEEAFLSFFFRRE